MRSQKLSLNSKGLNAQTIGYQLSYNDHILKTFYDALQKHVPIETLKVNLLSQLDDDIINQC